MITEGYLLSLGRESGRQRMGLVKEKALGRQWKGRLRSGVGWWRWIGHVECWRGG